MKQIHYLHPQDTAPAQHEPTRRDRLILSFFVLASTILEIFFMLRAVKITFR